MLWVSCSAEQLRRQDGARLCLMMPSLLILMHRRTPIALQTRLRANPARPANPIRHQVRHQVRQQRLACSRDVPAWR